MVWSLTQERSRNCAVITAPIMKIARVVYEVSLIWRPEDLEQWPWLCQDELRCHYEITHRLWHLGLGSRRFAVTADYIYYNPWRSVLSLRIRNICPPGGKVDLFWGEDHGSGFSICQLRVRCEHDGRRWSFHLILWQHLLHPDYLQTPQRQSLGDFWPPRHSLVCHSMKIHPPILVSTLLSPDLQHRPCTRGDRASWKNPRLLVKRKTVSNS